MKLDEEWIRAHLPEDVRNEDIDLFSGLYLDGLKVMSVGVKVPGTFTVLLQTAPRM